jgi:Spy/CpxP family protein refolding chaperone
MFRRTAMALSLVALLAGTGVVYAQTAQGQTAPAPRAHGMDRMKQRLGLSDDQATAVRAAFQKHRDEQKQAWKALHAAQMDLRKLALNGGDAGAIAMKTTEVQQLHGQTLAVRVKVLQEIGPVLTPEQRVKFAQAHAYGGRGRHGKRPMQS